LQCAIDNAKRSFDIDLTNEIRRIKKDMNLSENGYPVFWSIIRPGFNKAKINKKLKCPMNYLFYLKTNMTKNSNTPMLPMSTFIVSDYKNPERYVQRKCQRVEWLIQKYMLKVNKLNKNMDEGEEVDDDELLLRNDFEELISDLRTVSISKNYRELMYWMVNRAFYVTNYSLSHKNQSSSLLRKNRTLLLKILYECNSTIFLQCFSANLKKKEAEK
jgi:hypothetical protein